MVTANGVWPVCAFIRVDFLQLNQIQHITISAQKNSGKHIV
jgi:hypothetical protein